MIKQHWTERLNYELMMAKIDEQMARWEAVEPPIEIELVEIDDEEDYILFV